MYPVSYIADYTRERNRLTAFFRLIVAIPWLIVSYVYSIVQLIVIVIAWFALLILGRYPEGMYNLVAGILRFSMRVEAFAYLQTDEWPPFGISEDPDYPVRLNVAPPAESQSRLKTLFRIVLVFPLLVMTYPISFVMTGAAIASWLTIVFRGYQPAGIHNAIAWSLGWTARANAYTYLLRDEYPPVGDEENPAADEYPPAEPPLEPPAEPPPPEPAV